MKKIHPVSVSLPPLLKGVMGGLLFTTYYLLLTLSPPYLYAEAGFTINAGTVTLNNYSTLDVTGGITINAAAVLDGGTAQIRLTGDWSIDATGIFTANSSTVTFYGTGTSTLIGNTTFRNFQCTTAGKQLKFTAGSRQTVTGKLTLTGASGNLITLRSTTDGIAWELDLPNSYQTAEYVDVKNGFALTNNVICRNSTNSTGNNAGWIFNEVWSMVVYSSGTYTYCPYRIISQNETFISSASVTPSLGTTGRIQHVVLRECPIRDEYILGVLGNAGDIYVATWTVHGNWGVYSGNPIETAISAVYDDYRGFDIAYESQSGEALIVYHQQKAEELVYRTYSPSTGWSVEYTTTTLTPGVPIWIILVRNPANNSNEIACIWVSTPDATREAYIGAKIWDGTGWRDNSEVILSTASGDANTLIDEAANIRYLNQSNNKAMFVYAKNALAGIESRIWNGTSWEAPVTAMNAGNNVKIVNITGNTTDQLMVVVTDSGDDVETVRYDGSNWVNAGQRDGGARTVDNSWADVCWEGGTSQECLLVFSDVDDTDYGVWSGAAWTVTDGLYGAGDESNVVSLRRTEDGNIWLVIYLNDSQVISCRYWNPSANSWSAPVTLIGVSPIYDSNFETVCFEVKATTVPPANRTPNPPSNLAQYQPDWGTWPVGDWKTYQQIRSTFTLTDPDSGDTVRFNVQFSTYPNFSFNYVDFTSALLGTTPQTTNYITSLLPDGTWYWRVRCGDNGGRWSAFSSMTVVNNRHFGIDTTPPVPSAPIVTRSSTSLTGFDISFSATDPHSGTKNYWIYRATFVFTSTSTPNVSYVATILSPGTTHQDTSGIVANTTYYYTIIARDNLNNTSGQSALGSNRSARISIDGNFADWQMSSAPGVINTSVVALASTGTAVAYIFQWLDKTNEMRTDGTDPDSQYDIARVLITADEEYVYFFSSWTNVSNTDKTYFAIAIDTDQVSGQAYDNWIGDDTGPTELGGFVGNDGLPATAGFSQFSQRAEREIIIVTSDSLKWIQLFDPVSGTWWYDPPTSPGRGGNYYANSAIEFKVARQDLGLTGTKTARMSFITCEGIPGDPDDIDTTTDFTTSDALDSVSIMRISTGSAAGQWYNDPDLDGTGSGNSWNEDISDGDIDFWLDVRLDASGVRPNTGPSAPTNLYPGNDGTTSYVTPVLSWAESSDLDSGDAVTSYMVEFDSAEFTGDNPTGLMYRVNVTTSSWRIPEALAVGVKYFWRVSARDRCGGVTSSIVSSFTVTGLASVTPTLYRADTAESRIYATWSAVENADGYRVYSSSVSTITEANKGDSNHPLLGETVDTSTTTITFLANTTYWIAVCGFNASTEAVVGSEVKIRTARISVDGEVTDWNTTAEAAIYVNQSTSTWVSDKGTVPFWQWTWEDKRWERRTDFGGDLNNYDLNIVRITADEEYLYFAVKYEDIAANPEPTYFAVAIDTSTSGTNANWFADNTGVGIGNEYGGISPQPEYNIILHDVNDTATFDARIEFSASATNVNNDDAVWSAPGGAGAGANYVKGSNEHVEFKILRSSLNLTGNVSARFIIGSFRANINPSNGGANWGNNGDTTWDANVNDLADAATIVRLSTGSQPNQYYNDPSWSLNTWDEEVKDGDFDFWVELSFDSTGLRGNRPPAQPSAVYPTGNESSPGVVNTVTPTIKWNTVTDPDAGDEITSYNLQVSQTSDFSSLVLWNVNVPGTTDQWRLPEAITPNATYYWRVYARDKKGCLSTPSETQVFILDTAPLYIKYNWPVRYSTAPAPGTASGVNNNYYVYDPGANIDIDVINSAVGRRTITVDGNPADWTGIAPTVNHNIANSDGEWIYKGVKGDARTDRDPDTPNVDITEVRITCDNDNLYLLIKSSDITNINKVHYAICIDTDGVYSNNINWIGDDSKSPTADQTNATTGSIPLAYGYNYCEQQFALHSVAAGNFQVERWGAGVSDWKGEADEPGQYGAKVSAEYDVVEASISFTTLGISALPKTIRVTIAGFVNNAGWNDSVDTTLDIAASSDAIDGLGGDYNTSANFWNREMNNGDIGRYYDITLGAAQLNIQTVDYNINGGGWINLSGEITGGGDFTTNWNPFANATDSSTGCIVGIRAIDKGGNAVTHLVGIYYWKGGPPEKITNLSALEIAGACGETTGIRLTWTSPGDDGSIGQLTAGSRFHIASTTVLADAENPAYWSATKRDNAEIQISTSGVNPGEIQTYNITAGLQANLTYYFRVWTRDESGNWSDLSNGATVFVPVIPENTISGTVRDSETNNALPNIMVIVAGYRTKYTYTDTNGNYSFSLPACKHYVVMASSASMYFSTVSVSGVGSNLPDRYEFSSLPQSYSGLDFYGTRSYGNLFYSTETTKNYDIDSNAKQVSIRFIAQNTATYTRFHFYREKLSGGREDYVTFELWDDNGNGYPGTLLNKTTDSVNSGAETAWDTNFLSPSWSLTAGNTYHIVIYSTVTFSTDFRIRFRYSMPLMCRNTKDSTPNSMHNILDYGFSDNPSSWKVRNIEPIYGLSVGGSTPSEGNPFSIISTGDGYRVVGSTWIGQKFWVETSTFSAKEINFFVRRSPTSPEDACYWELRGPDNFSNFISSGILTTAAAAATDFSWFIAQQDIVCPPSLATNSTYWVMLKSPGSSAGYYEIAALYHGGGATPPAWMKNLTYRASDSSFARYFSDTDYPESQPDLRDTIFRIRISTVVTGGPKTITDLAGTSPTDAEGAVRLNWTFPGICGVRELSADSKYYIEYSTYDAGLFTFLISSAQVIISTGPVNVGAQQVYTITSLQEGVTYYSVVCYWDKALNVTSLQSNVATTYASIYLPAAITSFSALPGLYGRTILLSWISPGDDGWQNNIINGKFRIRYSTYPLTEAEWTDGTWTDFQNKYQIEWSTGTAAEPVVPYSGHTRTLTSLRSGVTYYIRIWTRDENPSGWSLASNHATAYATVRILSVSLLEPTTYNFGTLSTGISTISLSGIITRNDGNVLETYLLRIATGTAPPANTVWNSSTTAGNNQFVVYAIFRDTQPPEGNFSESEGDDILTLLNITCSATNFSDGTAPPTRGYNVEPCIARPLLSDSTMWFKFRTPLATSTTQQQTIPVIITATESE